MADLLVDVEIAMVDNHVRELRATEEAMRRMSEGGYGECDSCGEDIGYARLSVQPAAIRCVKCQERAERDSSSGAAPRL